MDLPTMTRIRQRFEASTLVDVPGEIANQVKTLALEKKIRPGQTVAVACSSRGIANYRAIVEAVVGSLRRLKLEPFIVPAMGSHGAATAEGQTRVLEHYGISETHLGVSIRSSSEVVEIGKTPDQIPVVMDRHASEADHIVIINRIKAHTGFEGEIESGLIKMMVIGLGKQKGAAVYHQAFFTYGYPHVLLSVARKVLKTGRVLFGVGVVEDGYGRTAEIAVLGSEDIEHRERDLLRKSKRMTPRLPFDDIDILIVDQIGKDISGACMDTKVIGRIHKPLLSKDPEKPRIKRIIACDLTDFSEGNAVGVGLVDFVTRRLVDKIDMETTYINAITGGVPEHAKIPLTLRNDRRAMEVAFSSIGIISREALRVMRIKNTKDLAEVEVSQAYGQEIERKADMEIIAKERPMAFDAEGNLQPF